MTVQSLQQRFSPESTCYGCGPANERGLRIESREGDRPDELVADWTAEPHHAAFGTVLNGGVIGTLLDCHMNWTAAVRLMRERNLPGPPGCVTAEFSVRLRRPTSTERPVQLRAWISEISGDRVTVEGEVSSDGEVTASGRGVFVAVGPDHPAYERW